MIDKFFKSEAASGILLLGVTVAALGIANSPLAPAYDGALRAYIGGLSLLHWINDGLMTLFFLLVGLEIKRELAAGGELSGWDKRALPGLAALGGMAVPALIYVAVNRADPAALRGWAIPTATDIAFSLGVLAMLGSRAPAALKIFLAALAILDDLLAVLIIALFYGSGLSLPFLGLAGLVVAALLTLNRLGVARLWPYLLLGLLLWACVLKSGIHATLAGVLLAFVMPTAPGRRLEHGLADWVAYAIVPIFAFANAGVSLAGMSLATLTQPITLGVAAGLVLGKQTGVFGAAWLGVTLGLARRPAGMSWRALYGVSLLCGIGFTISLFIGALAFREADAQAAAKLGVLAGSLVSGLLGWLVLSRAARARL
ncbi:MAG: Na(+)/H(+) antiporter NhaA [Alphaproteobacteria bacterium 65-7]|nr:MAG: Na(+)/H(+) antiporter NhaA [Alphaproteobacteria bacterium 65-7]